MATPAITYSGVEFFGFDLRTGENNLLVDHATLRIDRNNAFSANTNVTVDGGLLDFNGKTTPIGDLVVKTGGQVTAASIANQIFTVQSGTLTADTIVADSLFIGSQSVVFTATASDWTDAGLTLQTRRRRHVASLPHRHDDRCRSPAIARLTSLASTLRAAASAMF